MAAKFGSHFFSGGLHENGVKIPGVFGANVPTAHTTYTAVCIGLPGIGFVDCPHRTIFGTNSAFAAIFIGLWLERKGGKILQ